MTFAYSFPKYPSSSSSSLSSFFHCSSFIHFLSPFHLPLTVLLHVVQLYFLLILLLFPTLPAFVIYIPCLVAPFSLDLLGFMICPVISLVSCVPVLKLPAPHLVSSPASVASSNDVVCSSVSTDVCHVLKSVLLEICFIESWVVYFHFHIFIVYPFVLWYVSS